MRKMQETGEDLSEEEQDQIGRAALILASWDDEILERKTFNKLRKMKKATLSESRQDSKPSLQIRFPEPGKNIDGNNLPDYPSLPALRDKISKISPPFVKQLTPSDVSDGQCRLSIPNSFVENHYKPMLKADEDPDKGVRVTTYGPDGVGYPMYYKMWSEGKTYVLTSGWKLFRCNHNLVAHNYWVTVWMFRDNTDHLCFAIDWITSPLTSVLIPTRSRRSRIISELIPNRSKRSRIRK